MMTREDMLNVVVSTFGLENRWTIWFFECAEQMTDEQLFNAYILLEAMNTFVPDFDDDDDLEQGFDPYEGCYTYDC